MLKPFWRKTPLEKAADHIGLVGRAFAAQQKETPEAESQVRSSSNSGAVWDRDNDGPPPWQTGSNVPG